MSYNLKYRPSDFSQFIGNEAAVQSLLKKYPDWPNAFLFTGPPGVGKTTLGRLIGKQLQCKEMNIVELDAGQDRGIDSIRSLTKRAYDTPLVGKTKLFIIDEAQGLTTDAQQALLKVTEESPPDTYFVFCSTDPRKIIKALKERCVAGEINLLPLSPKELALILKMVIAGEGLILTEIQREIAKICIRNAEGIPRRVLMLFEKLLGYPDVKSAEDTLRLTASEEVDEDIIPMLKALDNNDITGFLELFAEYSKGNWESFRIMMGRIYSKKLLNSMISRDESRKILYKKIVSVFVDPVDNILGNIDLIYRFSNL